MLTIYESARRGITEDTLSDAPRQQSLQTATPASHRHGELIDGFGRRIDHLRLSVTSRCDLRCQYCQPRGQMGEKGPSDDLTDDQRLDLIRYLHDVCGLRQLRLTGGEPLLHATIATLITRIRRLVPRLQIAMTTNGRRLAEHAESLRQAGLDRLNVSLDTLDPLVYRQLTGGELAPVLEGMRQVRRAGFPPPRVNAVVLRYVNDHQLVELADWACEQEMEIRFLEAMPIGPAADYNRQRFVGAAEIVSRLSDTFELTPLLRGLGETAQRYEIRRGGLRGVVGIIAPVTNRFCGHCRRMRVTAYGRLYPCLLDDRNVCLREAWGGGRFSSATADRLIRAAIVGKKPIGPPVQRTAMVQLGG